MTTGFLVKTKSYKENIDKWKYIMTVIKFNETTLEIKQYGIADMEIQISPRNWRDSSLIFSGSVRRAACF